MDSIPDKGFNDFIKDKSGLLKFHALWCAPCKAVNAALKTLEEETGVSVYAIDIDTHSDVSSQYGISAVPTVIAIQNGEVVGALVGSQTKEKYMELAEATQGALEG